MNGATLELKAALDAFRAKKPHEGLEIARRIDVNALGGADEAARLGALLNACGELAAARHCFRRAWQLAPDRVDLMQSYAGSLNAAGEFDKAHEILEKAVRLRREDGLIWYALVQNRRQTPEKNCIAGIEAALAARSPDRQSRIFLHYALGKCLDDIGAYESAFAGFQAGARLKRSTMRYDVGTETRGLAKLRSVYSSGEMARATRGEPDKRPVFIVGLPRSGTTLLERIVSAHSRVESLGEVATFTHVMESALRRANPGAKLTRGQAIERSASLGMEALGRSYIEGVAPRTTGKSRFVDKMPLNFLYVGLIRKSLPRARVLLVRRGAMDNCWAMYSSLFRQAYPFSYNFDELSAYYAGFDALARHWHEVCGDSVLPVDYEAVTGDLEHEVRRIIDHLELPFEQACLEFHRNAAPVATASSTQVRAPVYRTSVGRWRHYEAQLAPLRRALEEHGIKV